MEERLGVSVEIAREIHNAACRSNVRADTEITNFIVSIGLALQGLSEECVTVDFLPEQMKGWIEFKRKNLQLAVQAGFLAAMIFVGTQIGDRMIRLWVTKAREMQFGVEGTQQLKGDLDKAQGRFGRTGMFIAFLERASASSPKYGLDRDYFFEVLSLIQSVRPADVFFGDINMGSNGELVIEGFSEQQKSAALMTQAMGQLPEVEKAALTRSPMQVRDPSGTGRGLIYSFQLTALLKGKRSKIVPGQTPEAWRGGGTWGAPGTQPGGPGGRPPSGESADRSS
jgi:hypothetical protein